MEFEKIEPDMWKPSQKGEFVYGTLISVRDTTGEYQGKKITGKRYCIEEENKHQVIVFGSTVLDDRMSYVKLGDKLKIVFDGNSKNKKEQDMKLWSVFRAKE